MLSNWTSAHKSVLICVDRLLQCCASLECSSPPVSYSITKPQHWHNDVNVFTDSEVEWKQALPAILIGKWFWELLKFKKKLEWKTIKGFNDTATNETLGGSSSGFFFSSSEILYATMKAKMCLCSLSSQGDKSFILFMFSLWSDKITTPSSLTSLGRIRSIRYKSTGSDTT